MSHWSRSRRAAALFILLGLLLALFLVVRDLRDTDVPEETGTLAPRLA